MVDKIGNGSNAANCQVADEFMRELYALHQKFEADRLAHLTEVGLTPGLEWLYQKACAPLTFDDFCGFWQGLGADVRVTYERELREGYDMTYRAVSLGSTEFVTDISALSHLDAVGQEQLSEHAIQVRLRACAQRLAGFKR